MHTNHSGDILALIRSIRKAAITVHQGPDGDAVGSALAWAAILRKLNVEAHIIAPDAMPDFLLWMPGAHSVITYDKNETEGKAAIRAAEAIFCLDFNAPDRLSHAEQAVKDAELPITVIDHHRFPTAFAKYYYIDDSASSTAELVYRIVVEMGLEALLDKDIATCLYTGIATDTGSFRFPSVTPAVMRIAAHLMELGVDHSRVHIELFDNNSEDMTRLRGYALSEKLVVLPQASTAYISLSEQELRRFNFKKGYTEGLVNQALAIKGVHLAALFTEGDGLIKISLRSHGSVDVNAMARAHFNGGGHVNAAGGRSRETMAAVVKRFEAVATVMKDQIANALCAS
jgi:phosphoesterase RecJ-like protein